MCTPLPTCYMLIRVILCKAIVSTIICNPIRHIVSKQVRLDRVCHVVSTFQSRGINSCSVSCFIASDNKSRAKGCGVYPFRKTFIGFTIVPNAHRRHIITKELQDRLSFFPCSFGCLSMRETVDTPRDTPRFTFFCVSYPCVFFGTPFGNFDDDTLNPCGFYCIIINIVLIIGNINNFTGHLICPPSFHVQSVLKHPE